MKTTKKTSKDYHHVTKDWGSETWVENNKLYCLKLMKCFPVWSSGGKYHFHVNKDEVFYITKGKVLLDIDGKEICLEVGDSFRIKPNTNHRFKSITEEARFIEVSTFHEDSDTHYI